MNSSLAHASIRIVPELGRTAIPAGAVSLAIRFWLT